MSEVGGCLKWTDRGGVEERWNTGCDADGSTRVLFSPTQLDGSKSCSARCSGVLVRRDRGCRLFSPVAMLESREFDRRVAGFRGDVVMNAVRRSKGWARERRSHLPQVNSKCQWPGEKGKRAL